MKIQRKSIILVLTAGLLLASALTVLAVPPLPSSFYGTVKVDGANVPGGTIVSAWIDGVKHAETTVSLYADDTVYGLNVPGDDPETPGIQGGVEGDTVVFYIGGLEADQTGTWHSGANVDLNLTASTPTQIIIVEKQTDPDGAPDSFTFTGDAAGTISDDQQIIVSGLEPGTYTSQETVPVGWDLTSIVCDDDNSSGNVSTGSATFQLEAGETVKCTFTNTYLPPKITVTKVVVGCDMVPEDFQLHVQGQDFTDDGSGTELTLTEGEYEVTEDDYRPAYITTFEGDCSGTAEAGDELECTVTNTENTPPTLSGLPNQIIDHTTSLPATIDLWAYASDDETPVSGLIYTVSNTPPAGAGVTLGDNRYVTIHPSTTWCGGADVTIRVTDPGGWWDSDTFRVAVTWSCPGPVEMPGAPVLIAPIDSSTAHSNRPTFAWHKVEGAEEYRIQVDDDADFSSLERDEATPSTDYTPASGLSGAVYYWRVRAVNESEVGVWSKGWTFAVYTPSPPEFKLHLPIVARSHPGMVQVRSTSVDSRSDRRSICLSPRHRLPRPQWKTTSSSTGESR
jgi:hypothetical protein